MGSLNGSNVYVRYKPETFCFECLLDMTAMDDDDEKKPVHDMVDAIEERLYDYNTEGHRPSFVKVQYGDITSSASSRHWTRNTPCSMRTASPSAPN